VKEVTDPDGDSTKYFPDCKEGRCSIQQRDLLLVSPVPVNDYGWDLDQVLSAIRAASFVPDELPALLSFIPLVGALHELYAGRIRFLEQVGAHSRWQDSKGDAQAPYLDILNGDCNIHMQNLTKMRWNGRGSWFVVRRK
jgi:hypothetical protein